MNTNKPTYDSETHRVTLPTVTGLQWKVNGVEADAGVQPAIEYGESVEVTAHAEPGYKLNGEGRWTFDY